MNSRIVEKISRRATVVLMVASVGVPGSIDQGLKGRDIKARTSFYKFMHDKGILPPLVDLQEFVNKYIIKFRFVVSIQAKHGHVDTYRAEWMDYYTHKINFSIVLVAFIDGFEDAQIVATLSDSYPSDRDIREFGEGFIAMHQMNM